jgi:hypothetical protein
MCWVAGRARGAEERAMPIDVNAASGVSIPTAGNRQRFADVFWAAWLTITAPDRQVIVAWWGLGIVGRSASPTIHLVTNDNLPASAECQAFEHTMRFNAGVADLMPDGVLASLIGHELPHVRHFARPGSFATAPSATRQQRGRGRCHRYRLGIQHRRPAGSGECAFSRHRCCDRR